MRIDDSQSLGGRRMCVLEILSIELFVCAEIHLLNRVKLLMGSKSAQIDSLLASDQQAEYEPNWWVYEQH